MVSPIPKIYDKLTDKWLRDFKGNGSCLLIKPLSTIDMSVHVIDRLRKRMPESSIFIVVDSYWTRRDIIQKLKDNNISEAGITILSKEYVNARFNYRYELTILVNLEQYDDSCFIASRFSKFSLFLINKTNISSDKLMDIYNHYPWVNNDIDRNALNMLQLSFPVKEYRIGCAFSDIDKVEYDKYDRFVKDCFNLFGDYDTILAARSGDSKNNISAKQVCLNIAISNGWNENLDKEDYFSMQIDECYNPNIIMDKAIAANDIIRDRLKICSDNIEKLKIIYDIIKDNPDKRYVIVSKRGEFASQISKYLNEQFGYNICGEYHSDIEPQILIDDNGNPILYKSGANKGKPRVVKAQAISNMCLTKFNDDKTTLNKRILEASMELSTFGIMRCLSVKSSSNDALETSIDGLIITSPICGEALSLKYRFNKLEFSGDIHTIYNIYMIDSIEETKIKDVKLNNNVTVENIRMNNVNLINDENIVGIVCE